MFINPLFQGNSSSSSPLQYHFGRRAAIVEKREHMFLRAMSKAMRYYRIWIYSCNVALFVGTFIYFVAFLTVILDSRLKFFTNIRLYQPTFIYCYCALLIQGGLLQTIGCLGALKLNERYLHIYLIVIFILLFGDGIIGVVWILRYNFIITNLKSELKNQISSEYQTNIQLQVMWNDFQRRTKCCGVDGPADYNSSSWAREQFPPPESNIFVIPISCCPVEEADFGKPNRTDCRYEHNTTIGAEHVFRTGCYDHLYNWLQSSVDLLSVLGFCVITFIKMCFLCLLRYEIKEMIEKIKVIKGQNSSESHMLPFQDLEAYLPRPSMQQESLISGAPGGNLPTQSPFRSNTITEKCHCRLGMNMTTNVINLSSSRMILSTSSANLSGCQSKKHSLV